MQYKRKEEKFLSRTLNEYIFLLKKITMLQPSFISSCRQPTLLGNKHLQMETQVQELISTQILEGKIKMSRLLNVPSFHGNKAYSLQAYFLKKKKLTKSCHQEFNLYTATFTTSSYFSCFICFSTLQNPIQILLHAPCFQRKTNTLSKTDISATNS